MPALVPFSYGLVALGFGAVAVLLRISQKGSGQGRWFLFAAVSFCVLHAVVAVGFAVGRIGVHNVSPLDALRQLTWLLLLAQFLPRSRPSGASRFTFDRRLMIWAGAVFCVLASIEAWLSARQATSPAAYMVLLGLCLIGVLGAEQLYRNASEAKQDIIRPLCVLVGVTFAYDLFLYSHAILLNGIDGVLFGARGVLALALLPLFVSTAKRHADWAETLFVSRQFVFYSTTLVVIGGYLVVMSAVASLIRYQGGEWNRAWQAAFLVMALGLLCTMICSERLKGRVKVFLAKHFYKNRYDYRHQWIELTTTLSSSTDQPPLPRRSIVALANVIGSAGGELWLCSDEDDAYDKASVWGRSVGSLERLSGEHCLVQFLKRTNWIVDEQEYRRNPKAYNGDLDGCSGELPDRSIVVPLQHERSLLGFVILTSPPELGQLNYEDRDLLKTCGRQIAAFLAEDRSREQLAESRQFEAFNKLAAFLVHDLRNVVTQQALLVENSARHKENQAFVDDMIRTVEGSVSTMRRILKQLEARGEPLKLSRTELNALVREVIDRCSDREPTPTFQPTAGAWVLADRHRLAAVLTHAIRNAQDATECDGAVAVSVRVGPRDVSVEISDDGVGMDKEFVRTRLFRPFDSTKGSRGMGIGAYQARELVHELGGTLTVESEPGVGTKFNVHLPLEPGPQSGPRIELI